MRSVLTYFLTNHKPTDIMAIRIKLKISSLVIFISDDYVLRSKNQKSIGKTICYVIISHTFKKVKDDLTNQTALLMNLAVLHSVKERIASPKR